MNLTSRLNPTPAKSTLVRCPSCETPASAASAYCGHCGCDLSPQSEYSWHDDRATTWSFGSFGYQAS